MRVIFAFILLGFSSTLVAQTELSKEIRSLVKEWSSGYKALFPPETRLDSAFSENGILSIQLDVPTFWLTEILDEDLHEEIIETCSGAFHKKNVAQINLLAKNSKGRWQPLSQFLSVVPYQPDWPQANTEPTPPISGDFTRRNVLLEGQAQPKGTLSGKTVWLSAGHGWKYDKRHKAFRTQRHNSFGLVEDFAAVESVNYHLLRYLYQAGANVWTVRERDMNTTEIIMDNDNPKNYHDEGSWTRSKTSGYEDRSYKYTITKSSPTATAHFNTKITKPGKYWVSVHYVSGINRTVDARYRIRHAGGESVVSVNQEVHGNTWVYLGQFYFAEQAEIILSNESSELGQAVIADAVRLGGGRGNVPDCDFGKSSGEPRYEEAARYFAAYQGFPHCFNDVITRPLYAEWELSKGTPQEQQNAIYLSWHSNANGSSGTETYVHAYRAMRGSRTLQKYIHKELIGDIRQSWDEDWVDRGRKSADFGELRALQTMPGVLLEMGFHDNQEDVKALLDPQFRNLAARAVYKGIVRYYAKLNGTKPRFLPESPQAIRAIGEGRDQINLSWKAPAYGGSMGDRASAYRVYLSENGKGFANGVYTKNKTFTFSKLMPGKIYYFQITAVNDGGESFPSPVVAVRLTEEEDQLKYLLVDGYDRMDRSLALDVYGSKPSYHPLGKTKRLPLERMNNYAYAVEHAEALADSYLAFDGATNEALTRSPFPLKGYDGIDWFVGKESKTDLTLSNAEQELLKKYLKQGGNLLISGSELAYHLDHKKGGKDFFRNYLRAQYVADDAQTQKFYTAGSGQLNGQFMAEESDDYPVHSPDVIKAIEGNAVLLKYNNGKTAGVGYKGDYGLIYLAIPFEAIQGRDMRSKLLQRWLEQLHGEAYNLKEILSKN